MDALTHAVEAYIGRSTTEETRQSATEAVKLVFENIETAYHDGQNRSARVNMLAAAYKAGVAFSKSYVGYIHAVAHSLGGQYGTPHGLANAVIMPYVLKAYGETVYKKLHKLGIAAIGSGILVERALQPADEGMDARKIAEILNNEKEKIVIIAMLDTLEYLTKGGRISKTVAFSGAVLNIKPVISVFDGEINLLGKSRGFKAGNNLLVQEIEKSGGVDFEKPVLLGYTGLSNALLLKYIEDSRFLWEQGIKDIRYTAIGSVIGTHAGPGAIAAAFFKK